MGPKGVPKRPKGSLWDHRVPSCTPQNIYYYIDSWQIQNFKSWFFIISVQVYFSGDDEPSMICLVRHNFSNFVYIWDSRSNRHIAQRDPKCSHTRAYNLEIGGPRFWGRSRGQPIKWSQDNGGYDLASLWKEGEIKSAFFKFRGVKFGSSSTLSFAITRHTYCTRNINSTLSLHVYKMIFRYSLTKVEVRERALSNESFRSIFYSYKKP